MSSPETSESHSSDDYGSKLYDAGLFKKLFPDFDKKQESSARHVWRRILSRCGTDPDLPNITHVVDYGCGEGTFLKHLAGIAAADSREFNFRGLDCSGAAIHRALNTQPEAHPTIRFLQCNPCPSQALGELFEDKSDWKTTALLVMSHTWFHFDQEQLIRTVLELRPALLLVDVYATWDSVITELDKTPVRLEHGRPPEKGKTFWLKTEKKDDKHVYRGVWEQPAAGEGEWSFQTKQTAYTTSQLFGGVGDVPKDADPARVLEEGRTNGMFICEKGTDKDVRYVRQMCIHHQSGWGPMDCHVLVSRDPLAGIFNDAFFKVMESSIKASVIERSNRHLKMISLFDDPQPVKETVTGSREALVLLAFDPCLLFARIVPLFSEMGISKISSHLLLIEHPSREQTHYPSANGVFQTCFARSSSVQAFATHWAADYQLTAVDRAIQELELEVLGLNLSDSYAQEGGELDMRRGHWGVEPTPPSYFMLPIYFGSLPLFCLALKFPKPFDPTTTSFDVFYSTLKSLHDDILVLLTDDIVRMTIIRPWIQTCLEADWAAFPEHAGVESKLKVMEEYLFGWDKPGAASAPQDYQLDDSMERTGGVLGRDWKSWVLGLPSFPIKEMASVKAMNKRLWAIWEEERRIAQMDVDLRISHWFQEGRFFDVDPIVGDDSHESLIPEIHFKRLDKMLEKAGYKRACGDSGGNKSAFFTEENPEHDYFANVRKHFLFGWLVSQLNLLRNFENADAFQNLKAVFCKGLANNGEKIRFGILRLWCLLAAAAGEEALAKQRSDLALEDAEILGLESTFWHTGDPSVAIAEFVHALASRGMIPKGGITCSFPEEFSEPVFVKFEICISRLLSPNRGGADCDRICKAFQTLKQMGHLSVSQGDVFSEGSFDVSFWVGLNGEEICFYPNPPRSERTIT